MHPSAERKFIARGILGRFDANASLERAGDAVEFFGDSWIFVGLFAALMALWVGVNAFQILNPGKTFDPYPCVLLNLFLSMLAAIQAPFILMSKPRYSARTT